MDRIPNCYKKWRVDNIRVFQLFNITEWEETELENVVKRKYGSSDWTVQAQNF